MLTKTSETAILAMLYLLQEKPDTPVPPSQIAERLGTSATYLAKIMTLLGKAGLLRAHHGTKGGVTLSREPQAIPLLDIVEACQGRILGDYCQQHEELHDVCAFHQAMAELHEAVVGTLSRWTLADLAKRPGPAPALADMVLCRLGRLRMCGEGTVRN